MDQGEKGVGTESRVEVEEEKKEEKNKEIDMEGGAEKEVEERG